MAVASAPRYDERIRLLVCALDDRTQPMAEVCRRVGAAADTLGLTRPSYVHLRRQLVAERTRLDAEHRRGEALRAITDDVLMRLVLGRFVHAYEVADRVAAARAIR